MKNANIKYFGAPPQTPLKELSPLRIPFNNAFPDQREGLDVTRPQGLRVLGAMPLVLAFLITAIAAVFVASSAQALELRIRNDFGSSLSAAVAYYDSSSNAWTTQGWYNVGANSSETFNLAASKQDIYIFSLLSGANLTWGKGDVTRVVISERFGYLDGEECPTGGNRRSVKFTKYTAKNNAVTYRPVNNTAPPQRRGG